MPEPAPPKPGRAPLLLLALLAAAFAAPPAGASHSFWFSWQHTAADAGPYYSNQRIEGVGRISYSFVEAGHQHGDTSQSCKMMKYRILSPTGGFDIKHGSLNSPGAVLTSPVTLTNNRFFQSNGDGVQHIKIWHAATSGTGPTVGVHTVSIEVENRGGEILGNIPCSAGEKTTVSFTITVAANPTWTMLASDSNAATGQFSPVRISASTARTPTGHRFHRNYASCQRISVGAAANAPAALALVRHDSGGGAVSGNDLTDIRMEEGDANDNHVRLMIKTGATLAPGVMTVTVEAEAHSSCTGAAPATDPSVEWKVTVATPAAWTDGARHDAEAKADLMVADLNAAPADTYTGLAWQRTAAGCGTSRAELHSDSRTIFGLYRYNGNTRDSSAAADEAELAGANEARVYLRNSYQQHADATLQVSMAVHGVCTAATQPWPDAIVWPVTVFAPAAWALHDADSLTPARVFSGPGLAESAAAVDTGVRIQRSSSACANTNVALGSHADKFDLYRYSAAGVRQGQAGAARIDDVPMQASGGDHVRLFFKAGVSISAPTTLEVELSAAAHNSCTDPRTPTAASAATAMIELSGKAVWVARANDRTEPSGRFSSYDLLDATAPTATGIQIHRSSSSACAATDVALGADTPSYLGLDLHGDGSGVALTASHAGVPMPGAGGTDRHLRLYFRAGAAVPDGTVEVTATLSAACAASSDLPDDLALVYRLTVHTPADHPWEELDEDSQELRAASFRQSEIRDGELATGIQLHRSSADCGFTDVELLSGTEHLELVRHTAAGMADGSGSALLEAVPMSGAGDAADRHVRLHFQAGAYPPGPALEATVRIEPAESCGSRRNPDPATFMYTLEIIEDVDPPPMIRVTPAGVVTIAADAAATGIRIAATDDDDADVSIELEAGSQARWSLARLGAGSYELRVRQGASLTRGGRYTVSFIARDDAGEAAESRGLVTVEIADGAPVIVLSAATVGLDLNQGAAAATGLTISARDDDASNVLVAIDAAARRTFELRSAAGGHELWVSAGVTLVEEERFTVTVTATDAEGPGSERSSEATAVLSVRSGSAGATEVAAVDAGAAAARAIAISGIDAVLNRPAAGAAPGAGTAFLEMLAAKREELESGEIDLRGFLEGQAVALPLSQTGGGGAGLGLWLAGGRSDVGGVTGEEGAAVYVDGEVSSTSFGVDARFGPLLAGLGYGLHKTTAEYGYEARRAADPPSEYELDLQALQPYVAFDAGGARLALAAAVGDGRLFLRPAGRAARERLDAEYTGYALGLVQRLPVFGAGELRLRGSYAASDLDVAEPADGEQPSLDAEGSALRLGLGYEHAVGFGAASSVNPFFEAGWLLLGGDGATESSGLVAGGLAYVSGLLRASASYQQALGDEATLEGYELSFRFSPRLGGLGLGFEADPGYGLAGAEEMFAELGAGRQLALAAEDERGLRGGAGLSYGLAVAGGLLTPYGRWSAGAGRELGLRLRAGARRSWALGYGAAADELKIEYRLGD